jgi:hypothetical protein
MSEVNETARYQEIVTDLLKAIFGEPNVIKEWNVAKNSQDNFTRNLYCPRVDIGVGPFNITTDTGNNMAQITNTFTRFHPFVEGLQRLSATDIEEYNPNPRCFLAIEIEKRGTRKHMLGDVINATSLGKIGLIIPWDEEAMKAFRRIKAYLDFIKTVKKASYGPKNLLIVPKGDFKNFLENFPTTR